VQLVTHHAPDEVKLVALVPHAEMTDWAWLRWLPHVWSDDRRERYIASTPDESRTLSKRLEELLGRRRDLFAGFGAERSNGTLSTPVYVFLIADAGLADHMPLLAEISASDISRLGATCLFLAPDRRLLPRACRTIVELSEDGADGRLVRPDGDVQGISALDLAPLLLVEQLATALASLQPRRLASPSALPSHVPILPLLGVEAVEELDVLDRWRRACADRSLAVRSECDQVVSS